jgi:hypothetical protein
MTSLDPEWSCRLPARTVKVTPAQVELLRRWIAGGAQWGRHWSFEPVERAGTRHLEESVRSISWSIEMLAAKRADTPSGGRATGAGSAALARSDWAAADAGGR